MREPAETVRRERLPGGPGGRFYGVHPAQVVDIEDPDGQGRIRLKFPWIPDPEEQSYETWARIATLMAGADRGTWFLPEVGDEVLVAFEHGDVRRPYVLGMLWNGSDAPPEQADASNDVKAIHSRSGIKIILDDADGAEKLTLETPAGNTIYIEDPGTIELRDSNGNSVKLDSSGVTVNASAKVSINASTVEVSAGMVDVSAGMSKFSGVVKADTVIANSVVSSSYTPGAGNIW